MLRKEAQQLKLLEGEVQRPGPDARDIAGLVDRQVSAADLGGAFVGLHGHPRHGQPQSRLEFSGSAGVEDEFVHTPISLNGG